MTELINAAVTHKIFGAGKITNLKNGTIIIQFESAEKKFLYRGCGRKPGLEIRQEIGHVFI